MPTNYVRWQRRSTAKRDSDPAGVPGPGFDRGANHAIHPNLVPVCRIGDHLLRYLRPVTRRALRRRLQCMARGLQARGSDAGHFPAGHSIGAGWRGRRPHDLTRDRSQRVFTQTFEQFSGRMISPDRLRKGPALLAQHAATFARIERQFGVPGPVLTAIWGLETDSGSIRANSPSSARWRRSLTIAAGPTSFAPNCSMCFASSTGAT